MSYSEGSQNVLMQYRIQNRTVQPCYVFFSFFYHVKIIEVALT